MGSERRTDCDECGMQRRLFFTWHEWPAPPRWLCRRCEARAARESAKQRPTPVPVQKGGLTIAGG